MRDRDRETETETERDRERQRQRQRDRDRDRETEKQRDRDRDRETEKQRDRDRQTDTETDRQTDRDIQTDRDTDRQTDRQRQKGKIRIKQWTGGRLRVRRNAGTGQSRISLPSLHLSFHFSSSLTGLFIFHLLVTGPPPPPPTPRPHPYPLPIPGASCCGPNRCQRVGTDHRQELLGGAGLRVEQRLVLHLHRGRHSAHRGGSRLVRLSLCRLWPE